MKRAIDLEELCAAKGLRITEQHRTIAQILSDSEDHPPCRISPPARFHNRSIHFHRRGYRTARLFEEAGVLARHEFGDGRARYEPAADAHHDHLIDVENGQVLEFVDPEMEHLQRRIAERLGFRLVDHRLELYAVKLKSDDRRSIDED